MREFPRDLVKPDYSRSIVNLSSWILKNFGLDTVHKPLDLDTGYEKIVLIIVDAMGAVALDKVMRFYRPRNFSEFSVLTSVFPSTTTSALTSFYTALTPSAHGMLGYILFLKEYGFLTNMIEFTPVGMERDKLGDRIVFDRFLRVPTVFQRLSEIGVKSYIVSPSRYQNSGLARILHRGGIVVGYTSIGDLILKVSDLTRKPHRALITVYIPNADGVGHRESERAYLNEIAMILRQIDTLLLNRVPNDVIYVITADHGMIRTPREYEIWWDPSHEIMGFLEMPPGGERRMMHLYTRNPERLLEFLEDRYPRQGLYLLKEEALQLFGGSDSSRIGDVVLIALKNHSFNFKYTPKDDRLRGMHGGLTEEEMLIPLVTAGGA